MKKPAWYRDSVVDRIIRQAPRHYYAGWLAAFAWLLVVVAAQHYGSSRLLTGYLALVLALGVAGMLVWTSFYI
jgi:hypothetical protein